MSGSQNLLRTRSPFTTLNLKKSKGHFHGVVLSYLSTHRNPKTSISTIPKLTLPPYLLSLQNSTEGSKTESVDSLTITGSLLPLPPFGDKHTSSLNPQDKTYTIRILRVIRQLIKIPGTMNRVCLSTHEYRSTPSVYPFIY